MDKGVLIEQGTHNELYERGGVYHMLVEKQKIVMKEGSETSAHAEEAFNIPNQALLVGQANPQVRREIDLE
jgi:hypothetical protein